MRIEELDLEDERIRAIIREELDRREAEAQQQCEHRKSGTMRNSEVFCDDCRKLMGPEELENAFGGTPEATPEPSALGQRRYMEKQR